MGRTTIEIDDALRDRLREERQEPESSYGDTIRRLLDGKRERLTEDDVRVIASAEVDKLRDELGSRR